MMIVTTLDGREIKCAARWRKLEILARLTCELEPEIGVGDVRITIKIGSQKSPEASRVEFHFILTVVLSGKY